LLLAFVFFTATVASEVPTSEATSTSVVISGVLFDPYLTNEPEEAVELTNVGSTAVDLQGWKISDNEGTVTFPAYSLGVGQRIWATRTATGFKEEFGLKPAFEYGGNSDPTVPDMSGTAPTFANTGDEVVLLNTGSQIVDAVVYKAGNTGQPGWSGAAVQPYDQGYFGLEGQILYRKLSQSTGLPVADTDTAADWAQTKDDNINGKKIQYPGWDLSQFFFTKKVTDSGELRIIVAPDHAFEEVRAALQSATVSIDIQTYTMENADLIDTIVARQQAGAAVRVLLEGEPVEGITDQERWAAQQIEQAGGQVYFMYNDDAADVHDRYNYQHAKFIVIDSTRVLVGSENPNYSGVPADSKTDGTCGNRGSYAYTTAPAVANQFKAIFAVDVDPANHKDLFRWTASDPNFGAPPAGFVPTRTSGGICAPVVKPTPLQLFGSFSFEILTCPESCLRNTDALIGLVNRAGAGDTVLVEQLYERKYWGPSTSNPTTDPNPRLEAYISAARRGATVKILLDKFYDDPNDPRGNSSTCAYVNGLGVGTLSCRLGNPVGSGIHNKMVLVSIAGSGTIHTGSINGSENSVKNNRETGIQIESTDAYLYLSDVFNSDWTAAAGGGGDITPPAAPAGLVATDARKPKAIDLDWANNTEADLDHYKVYYGTISGGPYDFVTTVSASTYQHWGLVKGVQYCYVVTAVDRTGNESTRSNESCATVK
jgi:hypothetical protein